MKKRLFICSDRSFPRGDAGANRILYMAKALREKNWDVVVVSIGRNEDKYYCEHKKCYIYEGVKYKNIQTSKNKIIRKLEHSMLDGIKMLSILKSFDIDQNDKLLLYSSAYPFSKTILSFAKKRNIKAACDIVEWHQPFQFKKGDRDLAYKMYKKFFECLAPSTKNIIAISKCLSEHFEQEKCHVVTVPIYIDADDRMEKHMFLDEEQLHLIYPGNPYRKDDLLSMLSAINGLKYDEKKRVVFHLTGVSKELLLSCIPNEEGLLDKLVDSGNVVIHSWLEYEELMNLYDRIDFALIARPRNRVTDANFPSKVPELFNKGIPVIINKVGDIADYLTDGKDCILYDGEGTEACIEALRRALSLSCEIRKEMRHSAFNTAFEVFNYHQCGKTLDEFFQNLI